MNPSLKDILDDLQKEINDIIKFPETDDLNYIIHTLRKTINRYKKYTTLV